MTAYKLNYPSFLLVKRGLEHLQSRLAAVYDNLLERDLTYPRLDDDINGVLYYMQMISNGLSRAEILPESDDPRKITVYSNLRELVEAMKANASQS